MIKASLPGDRHHRAAEAGDAAESLLESDLILVKELWIRMRVWYKDAVAPSPLARVTIKWLTAYRVELYRLVPPSVMPILVEVNLFTIEDSIPWVTDIVETVKRLHLNRSGGPSEMREEYLRQWLQEGTQ